MKMKLFAISMVSAALIVSPASLRAEDKDVDVKVKTGNRVSELNRKAHDKICQGHHGSVTAKTDTSISVDGKMYALTVDTKVNKQEEPLLPKTVKVGDKVCFKTEKAADGSEQISRLVAITDENKVRVREKELDSPSKVEVETPEKKNEVK